MSDQSPPSTDWYLIQTKPKQERVAAMHLQRQNYVTYLPFITLRKRVRNQYQAVREPMFSRYLFIQLSEETDNWGPIRSTQGVQALVRFGGIAAKVPASLIAYLQQREQAGVLSEKQTNQLQVGDTVRVIDGGVLNGYEGIITEKNNSKRVTLLLSMLGRETKVDVLIDNVAEV